MKSSGGGRARLGLLVLLFSAEAALLRAAEPAPAPPVEAEAPALLNDDAAPLAPNVIAPPLDTPSTSAADAVPVQPVAKPKPKAKPKPPAKKAPPVFPGPKVLPPTGPYKPLYFDNDFSYKGTKDAEYVLGEELKLIDFTVADAKWVFSTGGELRHRYMDQENRLQPGGPGEDTYQLWRWRHYFDLKAGDNFRFYVEGIDASSFGEDLPTQAIDENRWDLLNAFVDVALWDCEDGTKHTLRYGRQELLFGRQRLVSPLDWANTRRNFEGFRYMVKAADFKLDVFTMNPVNSATGFNSVAVMDHKFDEANRDVYFSGAYLNYTAIENTNLDFYYLWLEDQMPTPTRADGRRHTIGSRLSRLFPTDDGRVWDLDLEGAYQFGNDNSRDVHAGFATGVLGHTWKEAPLKPRFSGLVYWSSGDESPTDDENNTFYVYFPLGHAYWAISDNLSGQNLVNCALQAEIKPTDKTAITAAIHRFELQSAGDRLYNVAGAPVGTPGNGRDVGEAFDLYSYYAFNPNFDIQMGYSWFWYGEFIDRTTPRGDASQFYVQTSLRY